MTELLTRTEAADLLKCAPSTIDRYARMGQLQADRSICGKTLFKKEKVLRLNPSSSAAKGKLKFNTSGKSTVKNGEFKDVIEKWQLNSMDTNSADVQIGIHTEKILQIESQLTQISTEDPNFRDIRYSLLRHVIERRKLLHYLESSDYKRYRKATEMIQKETA